MDTTTTTNDTDLQTQTVDTTNVETTEQPKTDLPKVLREQIKKANEEKAKLQAELDAIRKAEEDKTKSVEEKLAEKDQKLKELEGTITQTKTLFDLEKKLLTEKINPELSDLIISKAKDLVSAGTSIDEAVEMLKSNYPTAFIVDDTPKPLGKVGISASTGNNTLAMTKEQVLKIINDPNKPLTKEVKELADQYGL